MEKLQKHNNDSEFYLDDEFYERMANEFIQKQNPPALSHNDIKLEEQAANKTELEEDVDRADEEVEREEIELEEEEDEGYNPLAKTSDGKHGKLAQALRRFANTAPVGNAPDNQPSQQQNDDEEEKKMSCSLSNDNLEIRIDINAPQFKRDLDREPLTTPIPIRESRNIPDEESDHDGEACKSMRDLHRRELNLLNTDLVRNNGRSLLQRKYSDQRGTV